VSGLAEFRYDGTEFDGESTDGLVVNFSAISDSTWDRALELLIDAVGDGIREE
jgi:GntR family transcriptional regulator/MocR family aminotransferase